MRARFLCACAVKGVQPLNKKNTAFYVETLLMVVLMLIVSLLIMRVYGAARRDSQKAQQLTNAVMLAENTAEYAAASDGPEALCGLLGGQMSGSGAAYEITAYYNEDMLPAEGGDYLVCVSWTQQDDLAEVAIRVCLQDEEIYSLDTAVYTGEAAA